MCKQAHTHTTSISPVPTSICLPLRFLVRLTAELRETSPSLQSSIYELDLFVYLDFLIRVVKCKIFQLTFYNVGKI